MCLLPIYLHWWYMGNTWFIRASLVAQTVKHLPVMRETWVWSLGWGDPLVKGIATQSSILARKIPWTEEPGRLQSMRSQRVGYYWVTSLSLFMVCQNFPIFFFWPLHSSCRIIVPQPGIELTLWQWKHWILIHGPPGNSQIFPIFKVE